MPSLPEDPAVLRALLLATLEQRDAAMAERDALAARNEQLHHLLMALKRRQFGQKSERLPEDQLLFAFEEIEATLATGEAEVGQRSKALRDQQARRRRGNRGQLPAHLPRIEQVLLPERETCPCCAGLLVEIGADSAERLDVLPARFRVLVTRRPKLACRACPGVVLQAPAPERLVPGGLPTEATVAQVLVARYADHLPLYRQAQMLARQGLTLGREVLADWLGTAAQEIRPVVRRLREILLASPRLFADETTLPVLDPGRGKVKKGYAWALARDDRPWGGTDPPAVVFRYAPGRGQEHARALLAGYRGIVQCDGYAAYKAL
ncbi:IS66 family transposase, partial [Teichococcus aestuarii]